MRYDYAVKPSYLFNIRTIGTQVSPTLQEIGSGDSKRTTELSMNRVQHTAIYWVVLQHIMYMILAKSLIMSTAHTFS